MSLSPRARIVPDVIRAIANPHAWRVTPVQPSHLGTIAAIETVLFEPDRAWDSDQFVQLHERGWNIHAVFDGPHILAGYVVFGLTDARRVTIQRFGVAKGQQRRGIGSALVLHVVKFAVDLAAVDVTANVSESEDLSAQCLLRSCYFRVPRSQVASADGLFHFVRTLSIALPEGSGR